MMQTQPNYPQRTLDLIDKADGSEDGLDRDGSAEVRRQVQGAACANDMTHFLKL